jgi:HK97 family phage major capsid protein
MADELKQLADDLRSTWETELKPRIEQLSTEAKTAGEGAAETKQAVDRVQDRLDELEAKMQKAALAPQARAGEQPEAIKHFVDFVRKGRFADDAPDEIKAMAIRDESLGGVLAPAEYIAEVIKGVVQYSPIRNVAKIRKTSRTSAQAPKRTGNFAAQWTAETGTRTETTGLTYGLEEIPTHELYARVVVSNWDLEDPVVDLEADIREAMAEQFGVAEGAAFCVGDSNGKPEGLTTQTDIESVNNGATSFTNAVGADGLIKVLFALKEQYWANASWLLARLTLRDIRLLKDSQNNYVWQPGVAGGAGVREGIPATILDHPYTIAKDMPAVASNALSVAIGDFQKAYWIVDRLEIATLRDPFTAAATGQVVLHARKRVGGQVVLPEAIKLLKMAA